MGVHIGVLMMGPAIVPSCTLLRCCLFFNCTQFVILENLSVLSLGLLGVTWLTDG